MASLSWEQGKRARIQFIGTDGKRHSIRLGKVPKRMAEGIERHIEQLLIAKKLGHPVETPTEQWVNGLQGKMLANLVKYGLAKKRENPTLGTFVDGYAKRRSDVKESTKIVYARVRRYLVEFFGEGRLIREITSGEADDWRRWLNERVSLNTANRSCGIARQFFRDALKRKLIEGNPFGEMKGIATRGNSSRQSYISREDAQKVLDACPDAQWRLIFGLCRYGGLRCPSEIMPLKWGDIDFARDRFTVRSPKTEHHYGKATRLVPIFPELRPLFEEVRNEAEGNDYVITRYRLANINLRTQLQRIISKAGVERWPGIFKNLRSTRQTELVAAGFGIDKVCRWLGNGRLIAQEHYLQQRDVEFTEAAGKNAAQKTPESAPEVRRESRDGQSLDCRFLGISVVCDSIAGILVGGTGRVEPPDA